MLGEAYSLHANDDACRAIAASELAMSASKHESLADIILAMQDSEILRVVLKAGHAAKRAIDQDIYVWIDPNTSFFRGLTVAAGKRMSRLSEESLSALQCIRRLNQIGFLDGVDEVELITDLDVNDLHRLDTLTKHKT